MIIIVENILALPSEVVKKFWLTSKEWAIFASEFKFLVINMHVYLSLSNRRQVDLDIT